MIKFTLNGKNVEYTGDENVSLLKYLKLKEGIISVKDGCSGQAACGACLVEINGDAKLSCVTTMAKVSGCNVITMEGIPESIKLAIGKAFVEKGAVQCGFCTPGFIMRTKILLSKNTNPTREEIKQALVPHLCRCTGYKKIVEAIEIAVKTINNPIEYSDVSGKIGSRHPKYQALETALGQRAFVNDMQFEGMLYSALRFSDYPRAKVIKIDITKASQLKGVVKIFTAKDIPGEKYIGLIKTDWPLMIGEGSTTHYIGDVIAGVVAESEDIAREAVKLIDVQYEVLTPITDMHESIKPGTPQIHEKYPNKLETCRIVRGGNAEDILSKSAYVAKGVFNTQRIEHAFLECEAAIAMPTDDGGLHLYSQTQGVYEDRRQISIILNLPIEKVRVTLVPNGGGFGGKEDMTVQGHVSLYAFLLKRTVKLALTRPESIRMHPKRHPIYMDFTIGCDEKGMLTAVKLYAVGDTGAYASVGTKVLERVGGHATGAYFVPCADIEAITAYTNNIPCGAMRGFGANQAVFALESLVDELCEKGGFDRWQFRYQNALEEGKMTSTGQVLKGGVGVKATLEAVKELFYKHKYVGLACGLKNSGVGNGMPDYCNVKIAIKSENHVEIQHGWTEMGQGVHSMAMQTLCEETNINPDFISVVVDTKDDLLTGMTTSSRATALVGNAIIDAAKSLRDDLKTNSLKQLVGRVYEGGFMCDWTTKPGDTSKEPITHYSYSYATQLVVLNDNGEVDTIYAAHDAGRVMNQTLFEGQIEGSLHMGLGYALTEDLPMENGYLVSDKLKDCGVLRVNQTPNLVAIAVEVKDPIGPYGAKGLGEIGLVPTAGAVANALYQFDGIRRYSLPMKRKK